MSNLDVMYSSGKDDWGTPINLFESLHKEFNFNLDGAANESNHLCSEWLGPGGLYQDALLHEWGSRNVFLNPPYSQCKQFIAKAVEQSISNSAFVCALIPARTDTKFWHDYIWDTTISAFYPHVSQCRFIKGRLKFTVDGKPSKNSAPFPSCLVMFGDPN